ncbi:protein NDR1-like [Syzygium oleosum]|uniref:protein NDR1-like n=1 Tax=Syzygium oleosum TaxID=219896 RepID=UPI0024B980A0|nr:protein NDR1-like [Syzygium oleosum]
MSEPGGCCRRCCGFIFTCGLSALFLWLALRVSKPSCSIHQFYLPALNGSSNTPAKTTIFLDVKLSNVNKEKGIHYDPVNLTVYCFSGTNRTKWVKTIPGFYQGHGKKATKNASVETLGVNWTDFVVAKDESLVFRVDLATAVRFKIMLWNTKRHKLMVGANVTLNAEGAKNTTKDIKLKSGVCKNLRCCCFWQFGIISSFDGPHHQCREHYCWILFKHAADYLWNLQSQCLAEDTNKWLVIKPELVLPVNRSLTLAVDLSSSLNAHRRSTIW